MNHNPKQFWVAPAACIALATLFSGCASTEAATARDAQITGLQARLEESERANGRMTVRIEELEDQIFLLQDRVEANRLALQRKGVMRGTFEQGVAQAPQPTSETYYDGGNYRAEAAPQNRRTVTRIPMYASDPYQDDVTYDAPAAQDVTPTQTVRTNEAEVVITDKEYAAFVGDQPRRTPSSQTEQGSTKRVAQEPVTAEKLNTTGSSVSAQELEQPTTAAEKSTRKDALGIYKDSLTAYRAGNYDEALNGFNDFLASKPRADYVDNALYWLGECEFGLRRFDKSIAYFERVLSEQPDGNKVPDALLKMSARPGTPLQHGSSEEDP
ncbi:MAG: tetratricopeptide repeat protein [bacterium]